MIDPHRVSSVIGLDPSVTSFGIGRVDVAGDVTLSESVKPKKLKGVKRLLYLQEWVMSRVEESERPLVVLEGYAYSRVNLTHLAEVVGVVKLALFEAGIPTVILTPGGLKKFVTGRGNAKKDEMRLEIYKRFEFEDPSVDSLEAVALAYSGWHWLQLEEDGSVPRAMVPKAHLVGLSKMEEFIS